MRTRTLFLLASLACPAAPAGAGQTGAPAPDIRALEEALARGLVEKNRATLDRLLAPGFVLRGAPDTDRATWLENAVAFCWGDEATIDDFALLALENGAVATFVLTTNRDPLTCEPAVVRSVITDLWRPAGGSWRLALRQSGPAGAGITRQFERSAPPAPRWDMRSELSLVSTAGNTSTQTLGLGGDVTNRSGPWLTKGALAFVRATADGEQNARSLGLDFRIGRDLTPRAGLFGHTAFLRDTFAGIDHRIGLDGGLAYQLLVTAPHRLGLDAGVGYTREARRDEADRSFATGSLTLNYSWALGAAAEITSDGAFTANLQDDADWRFTSTTALGARLGGAFSLRLSYLVKYLNLPVSGFRRTDTIVSAAIVARFSR